MSVTQPVVRPIVQGVVQGLFGVGGGSNPLVFHALDDVGGSFVNDVIKGVGVLTEANTSTRYYKGLTDWESFGSGVAGKVYAGGKWWLVGQKACTNSCLHNTDFTNAAWVKVNGTAAKDATGLTGGANGASTLTATSANATFIQTITAASGEHATRFFVRRKTGTGTIELTVDGGTAWTAITITASYDDYQIDQAAVTNPGFGLRIVTSGDEVEVGSGEGHLTTTKEAIRRSSPLFTSGSAVTINASDMSFDDANHDDTQGGYYCKFRNAGFDGSTATRPGILGFGLSGRLLYTNTTTTFRSYDGLNVGDGPIQTPFSADDSEYELGIAYGDSLQRINTGGTWGSSVAYDGAYDNSFSELRVLTVAAFNTTGCPATFLIRDLKRWNQSYTAVQDTIDGEMP